MIYCCIRHSRYFSCRLKPRKIFKTNSKKVKELGHDSIEIQTIQPEKEHMTSQNFIVTTPLIMTLDTSNNNLE